MNIENPFPPEIMNIRTFFRQKLWVLETLSRRNYEYWNLYFIEIMNIGTFYREKLWILEPFTSRNCEYWNLLPPEIMNIGTILTKEVMNIGTILTKEIMNIGTILTKEVMNIGHQLFGVKNEYWGTQFYLAIQKLRPVNMKNKKD